MPVKDAMIGMKSMGVGKIVINGVERILMKNQEKGMKRDEPLLVF